MANLFNRGPVYEDSGGALSDWKGVIDFGTRITKEGSAAGSEATIYTVPAGKVLYVYIINLTAKNTGGAVAGSALVYIDNNTQRLSQITVDSNADAVFPTWSAVNSTPSIPIAVTAGEVIKVIGATNLEASGLIVGYLLDA